MLEPMDDGDEGDLDAATVGVFGKENSDRIKAGLMRLGGDMKKEGGYRFFLHNSKEREFQAQWIWNVGWMAGFDGMWFVGVWLIVVEETRNMMVETGFVKDMLTLHERLPVEVVLWSLEHRISTSISDDSRI
jgi:hypothetical protein